MAIAACVVFVVMFFFSAPVSAADSFPRPIEEGPAFPLHMLDMEMNSVPDQKSPILVLARSPNL